MSERLVTNKTLICPGCKQPLAANAPQGLCPECLLKAGLGSGVEIGLETRARSESQPKGFVAPALVDVAKAFPQLEIQAFLGQGGMGAVYRARQKTLDRVVALKILPPGIGGDPAFAERFAREAKALARLSHPGIVILYEFGQADGLYYFLMEFVDGVNLRHLLEVERISAREALAIVPQICDALQYAHDHGIVHRDIKPENILMDRQGRVKVADFGLAKLVGPETEPVIEGTLATESPILTEAGKVMGTPRYMAPEQRDRPSEVDHRADIYSLGVVIYQMLTGELPGRPIELPSRKVQVDVRLDDVVLRALEKEPARRYQQVSQVKTAVEAISGSSTAAASPDGTPAAAVSFGQIVGSMFGVTFRLPLALKLANLSALGFLSFLGFLPVPIPGWSGVFGLSGFFGLIGVAFLMEDFARRKRIGALKGARAQARGKEFGAAWRRVVLGALGLVAVSAGLIAWAQRPQLVDRPIVSDSPDGQFSALASTWRAMRVFGADRLTYRFTVQGRGGAFFERWEIPVPIGELMEGYAAQPLEDYFFEKHGRIQWSEDNKKVSFLVRGIEVSALNTLDRSYSSQEGFQPVREVSLSGGGQLQECFLELETGKVRSAPKELVEALRTSRQLGVLAPGAPVVRDWMRTNGLDIVKRVAEEGITQVDGASVMMAEKTRPRAARRAFDTISTDQVMRATAEAERVLSVHAEPANPLFYWLDRRAVFAFKTREGAAGLLEVVEDDPRSNTTRLRYKLVQTNSIAEEKFLVEFREAGLVDAINSLAKQAKVNCILDPNLAFVKPDAEGRPASQPLVTFRWENVTTRQAFARLLNNYNLKMIDDPQTGVARITTNDAATNK
jgi:predicted Ser/Thr protein kinase